MIDETGEVEIHFTDEQTQLIIKAINKEIYNKSSRGFWAHLGCNIKKVWNAFLTLIVNILTLKNTGKWISVITVGVVLSIFWKFLAIHKFSIIAMTLVAPYIGQIAIVVFGVIGGFKGASSLIEKVRGNKALMSLTQGKDENEEIVN